MIRTQISLTEEQMERLRRESARTGKSLAQLVREAIDGRMATDDYAARVDRIKALAGRYRSGLTDLAENHDEHYARAVEERLGLEPRRAP